LLLLLIVFFASITVSDSPRLWGQHLFALLFGSPMGLMMLMPLLSAALALLAYGILFALWLPISFVSNSLRRQPE
jgi:hypothetical protein